MDGCRDECLCCALAMLRDCALSLSSPGPVSAHAPRLRDSARGSRQDDERDRDDWMHMTLFCRAFLLSIDVDLCLRRDDEQHD